jgi:hypothetical protein
VSKRWLLDREDPRTVLLASVFILVVGGIVAFPLIADGRMERIFASAWLAVSVGQLAWAAARYRRWRLSRNT